MHLLEDFLGLYCNKTRHKSNLKEPWRMPWIFFLDIQLVRLLQLHSSYLLYFSPTTANSRSIPEQVSFPNLSWRDSILSRRTSKTHAWHAHPDLLWFNLESSGRAKRAASDDYYDDVESNKKKPTAGESRPATAIDGAAKSRQEGNDSDITYALACLWKFTCLHSL